METYFNSVPEDVILHVLFPYLEYADFLNLLAVLSEDFNRRFINRKFSQLFSDDIVELKPKSISWTQISVILHDYYDHLDKYDNMTFSDLMSNLNLLGENMEVHAMNDMRKKYQRDLTEFLFKIYVIMYSPFLANRINWVIHVLGNNDPWYHLLRIFYIIVSDYENLDVETDEDQQEYFDEEEERQMLKEKKLYEDRVEKYHEYITGNIYPMIIGDVSINRFPILLIYLYYIDQRIFLSKEYKEQVAARIARKMIKDLPIKLILSSYNFEFLMNIFKNPNNLKRILL